jgi:hypothetical protein
MSEPTTMNQTPQQPVGQPVPGGRASWWRVVRDQRKACYLALGFIVASFWILIQLDRPTLAGCVSAGVLLGLANHLTTEFWLLKIITSGHQATRNELIGATLVRLAVLSVVAVGAAVAFWPDGIGLLLGLAIFRLVALLMTSITLLKELKES